MTDPNLAAPRDATVREALMGALDMSRDVEIVALCRVLGVQYGHKVDGHIARIADALLAPREDAPSDELSELQAAVLTVARERGATEQEIKDAGEDADAERWVRTLLGALAPREARGEPEETFEAWYDRLRTTEARGVEFPPLHFAGTMLHGAMLAAYYARPHSTPLPAERGRGDELEALSDKYGPLLLSCAEALSANIYGNRLLHEYAGQLRELRAALSPDAGGKP